MDRRNFLRMMIGGVAAAAVERTFPFRVYSFPSEIVIAKRFEQRVGWLDFDGAKWKWTSLDGTTVKSWNLPPISPNCLLNSPAARREIALELSDTVKQLDTPPRYLIQDLPEVFTPFSPSRINRVLFKI